MAALTNRAAVEEAEERLRADRKHANELIELIDAVEGDSSPADVRLAAVQACRALFEGWAAVGELVLLAQSSGGDDEDEAAESTRSKPDAALSAYRAWLLRAYRRFAGALRALLGGLRVALPLRLTALDSLMVLASLEVRHAKSTTPNGKIHVAALDHPSGSYRLALDALTASKRPPPRELLDRFEETHLPNLDAAYYLVKHVQRLAKPTVPAKARPAAERLVELLLLVTPPSADVPPAEATLLALPHAPLSAGAGGKKRKGGGEAAAAAAAAACLPNDAKRLLTKKAQRSAYCHAWRAILALPLPPTTLRAALRILPERVFPHVPRPLVYCDLLSDGYAKGGIEAVLALRGLFVLMTKHNLEYPHFYRRLYALLTPRCLDGPERGAFALELQTFLGSSGLPAYLLCAYAKRLGRLALHASPSGAALAVGLIFNLLLRHPAARALVHRPPGWSVAAAADGSDADGSGSTAAADGADDDEADNEPSSAAAAASRERAALLASAAAADPFRLDEGDPERCGASGSCLWEADTLRQHCCPTVASLASLLAAPMIATTTPVDLEPLGVLTYTSLGQLETRKRLRTAPVAMRLPKGLFARPDTEGGTAKAAKLGAGLDAWRD